MSKQSIPDATQVVDLCFIIYISLKQFYMVISHKEHLTTIQLPYDQNELFRETEEPKDIKFIYDMFSFISFSLFCENAWTAFAHQ